MTRMLRPRMWASSSLEPCDVPKQYVSGPSACGRPVAQPFPRSHDGVSCIMRVSGLAPPPNPLTLLFNRYYVKSQQDSREVYLSSFLQFRGFRLGPKMLRSGHRF
jgi:hypothetical protein